MLVSAFVLGFLGSLHCVGMCGPLILAFSKQMSSLKLQLLQQVGRVLGYAFLGVLMGLVGDTFALFTFQQQLSLISGIVLFLFALVPLFKRSNSQGALNKYLSKFQSYLMRNIKYAPAKFFMLGVLNAFLPCGLLYVALAASASVSGIEQSMLYMVLFGLGTFPALFTIAHFGKKISLHVSRFQSYLVPSITFFVASLLVVRGLGLGIPYVSPKFNVEEEVPECCKVEKKGVKGSELIRVSE